MRTYKNEQEIGNALHKGDLVEPMRFAVAGDAMGAALMELREMPIGCYPHVNERRTAQGVVYYLGEVRICGLHGVNDALVRYAAEDNGLAGRRRHAAQQEAA